MEKRDIGKLFTTDGKDTWKMVGYYKILGSDSTTYHMKDLETSEELTQLNFDPKDITKKERKQYKVG